MKSSVRSLGAGLAVVALFLALMTTALAQTYTATVTGTVSDAQGAAVAGAKIIAVNQGTKLEYNAQTSDSGVYTIPFLPVGNYVITVEAGGFKKFVTNGLVVSPSETKGLDIQMEVGGASESIRRCTRRRSGP